jgi:hypothetical protein
MTTVAELHTACQRWLADPAHQPVWGTPENPAGQDQYDLRNTRVRIAEVASACRSILRNESIFQVLNDAAIVRGLLG